MNLNFLNENDDLIEDILSDSEDVDEVKAKIQRIIEPLNKCKEPESVLRGQMIEKYLKKYLLDMVNP